MAKNGTTTKAAALGSRLAKAREAFEAANVQYMEAEQAFDEAAATGTEQQLATAQRARDEAERAVERAQAIVAAIEREQPKAARADAQTQTLPDDARILIEQRWRAGRVERGLAPDAPFAWDREPIGADEVEESVDLYIYRRERYRCWYGADTDAWPYFARQRLDAALHALEDLLAELRHGPLEVRQR